MAYIITLAIQKGGVAKTTTTAITAYLLSENYKVLMVDLDSQGNLTEVATLKPIRDFRLEGIGGALDAIKEGDPRKYILQLTENLHILPADEMLGTLDYWLFTECMEDIRNVVGNMLDKVKENYDFIIIDTPPALGYTLANALTASDGVVALFETSKFCYSALCSFYETVEVVKAEANQKLKLLGILCSMIDARRSDNKDYLQIVNNHEIFGPYCFKTIIKRCASTGRIGIAGLFDNPEIKEATAQFKPFLEEVLQRAEG